MSTAVTNLTISVDEFCEKHYKKFGRQVIFVASPSQILFSPGSLSEGGIKQTITEWKVQAFTGFGNFSVFSVEATTEEFSFQCEKRQLCEEISLLADW